MNPVVYFILLIYLGAGFANGKGLGELLSPFDLFGFIFWLYIGFLVFLFFLYPNQKQGQEIGEKLKKEEGEFKVLCIENRIRAGHIAFEKGGLWHQWLLQMDREKSLLLDWCCKISGREETIAEYKKYIAIREREPESEERNRDIQRHEEIIKRCEEEIKDYTKKLEVRGFDKHRQPISPRTWDDVEEDIKKYGTML